MFNNHFHDFFDNVAAAADMATATKHSPSTTPSSSSVPGSPQSPNGHSNNNNTNFHQIHHHIGSQSLSSPSHLSSYEYTKRVHQGQVTRQSYVDGNQEEISSIAKQISDHAEAIYQTWKARGLAPTEILNCQLSTAETQQQQRQQSPNILDPVTPPPLSVNPYQRRLASPPPLSYTVHQTMPLSTTATGSGGGATALNELLTQPPDMSNNNKLEKLVNSFVNEDKARIAAQRRSTQLSSGSSGVESSPKQQSQGSPTKKASSGLPSLSSVSVIKQTLQKFENQNNNNSPSAKNFNLIKPKAQSPVLAKFGGGSPLNGNGREDRNNNSPDEDSFGQRQQLLKKNLINSGEQSKHNVPDVLLGTINSSNGSANKTVAKPQTPVKPPNLLNHVPSWPLKNRAGSPVTNGHSTSGSNVLVHEIHIERSGADSPDAAVTIVPKLRSDSGGGGGKLSPGGGGYSQNKMKSKTKGSSDEPPKQQQQQPQVSSVGGNQSSSELVSAITRKGGKVLSGGAAASSSTGLKKANPQLLEDAVKREEECLINALKTGGQVLKSSGLVSDSMLKMTTQSEKRETAAATAAEAPSGGSLPVRNKLNSNPSVSGSDEVNNRAEGSPDSDNNTDDGVNGEEELPGEEEEGDEEDKENSDVTVNFELSTDVAGPPPSNLAHHVPKVWQNEDGVFEVVTAAQKPTVSSKMFKTRPVRSSVLETMIQNENFNAKVATAKRDKELGINPITPFLTRGSVAERVLIFERCPEIRAPPRMPSKLEPSKLAKATADSKSTLSHTTLQRHIKGSSKNVYIPRFHFPSGKPMPQIASDAATTRVHQVVHQFPNSAIPWGEFHKVVAVCGLPVYWKGPLFHSTQLTTNRCVDGYRFMDFYKHLVLNCHDAASKFVYILSKGNRSRQCILPEDLVPLVQDVVDVHPGLAFLKEAPEFHSRYVHTVIARIFYSVNRSWSGKITVPELRRSNLLQVLQLLEEEEDINQIMAYFSYEHFYVIYCKFWELDRDHDLYIDQNDLARHNDHALSLRMIERIFCGCVTRGGAKNRNMGPNGPRITYTDFVWFLLSEEDKSNPTAMEYWFRCMDLDGDGVLSMYELEYFYEEQQQRMESIGIETLPFEDCICQMLDMIKPMRGAITLGDLKRCKMTPIFFDTFFNLEKYLEHEQRDPFATQRDLDEMSDWDRYAAQEYELLVAEEGGETQGSYDEEEDYESNIDILEQQLDEECTPNGGGGDLNEW